MKGLRSMDVAKERQDRSKWNLLERGITDCIYEGMYSSAIICVGNSCKYHNSAYTLNNVVLGIHGKSERDIFVLLHNTRI